MKIKCQNGAVLKRWGRENDFQRKREKKDMLPGNRNNFQGWIREKALSQNFSALFRINKR